VVSENGPVLSGVKYSSGGEARLCGVRINKAQDISHLAPFQTRSGVKSLGATVVSEANRLCHGVST